MKPLLLATVFATVASSTGLAQDIIAVSFAGNSYAIDSTTGGGALLAASGFGSLNAMGKVAGTYWTASGGTLVSIDPVTGLGAAGPATGLISIRGLAGAGGSLFAIENGGGTTVDDLLYRINPLTGAAVLIGTTTGFSGLQGLAFDGTGALFGWDIGAGLVRIDPATAVTVDVNPAVGAPVGIQCLAFSPSGTLYGCRDELYTIDAIGNTALVGSGGYTDVRGIEFTSGKPKIYCNGPLVTHPGAGAGGGDASAVQTALGMNVFGFGANFLTQQDLKDDFCTNGPWRLDCICLYAYQTNATFPSIVGVHVAIYNDNPNAGGVPVPGSPNFTNNLFVTPGYATTVAFTDTYRVLDTNLIAANRRVQKITIRLPGPILLNSAALPPGQSYWLRIAFEGSTAFSGPWVPPVTTLGVTATGNAEQTAAGTRTPIVDVGPQALPFDFLGASSAIPGDIRNIGGGCGPTAVRNLDVRGAPVVGGTIFAELSGIGALALPGMIVGLSDPNLPFPGCTCVLHAALDFLYVPATTWQVMIPQNCAFVGSRFYVQGVQFDFLGTAGFPCNLGFSFKLTDAFCVQLW